MLIVNEATAADCPWAGASLTHLPTEQRRAEPVATPVRMAHVGDRCGLRVVRERCRLPTDALRELGRRLEGCRKSADLGAGWDRGVPGDWLRALLEDWRVFDTDGLQLRLDAICQQRAEIAGHMLHVVHAEGRGQSPLPLILTHGWPGSFLEYLPVLALLSDSGAHETPPTRLRSSFRRFSAPLPNIT
jgi:hypothetical protein